MSQSTQLTLVSGYNVDRMMFSISQECKIPNSSFSYKRINISTKNDDGTTGDLVLRTPLLFSFGVQESLNMDTKEVNGYVMPLCLWNRHGPTEEEKVWTDTFERICEQCKDHLLSNKKDIGKWDLEMADLKKFNPMYWKRDKSTGQIEPGTGPMLYAKLIVSKRDGNERIMSVFYDPDTEDELNPVDILGKYCNATAAIKIESIFIGNRISLQVKLWEVEVSLHSTGVKRLLRSEPRPTIARKVEEVDDYVDSDGGESCGSIDVSEDEEFVSHPSPPRKPVSKRRGAGK